MVKTLVTQFAKAKAQRTQSATHKSGTLPFSGKSMLGTRCLGSLNGSSVFLRELFADVFSFIGLIYWRR